MDCNPRPCAHVGPEIELCTCTLRKSGRGHEERLSWAKPDSRGVDSEVAREIRRTTRRSGLAALSGSSDRRKRDKLEHNGAMVHLAMAKTRKEETIKCHKRPR